MSLKVPAPCTIPKQITKDKSPPLLKLKCVFGRRIFYIMLVNKDSELATTVDLARAIMRETNIPMEKQCLFFKGIVMSPPEMSGLTTLNNINLLSGDKVIIMNAVRVATDDEEKKAFEDILVEVRVLDKSLATIFYELDKTERGGVPCCKRPTVLNGLRTQAIELEKEYMKLIERANNLHFDYRNAVDQAKRRQMIDSCQRQMDKIADLSSAIFDKLAVAGASIGGGNVLIVAKNRGPCPRPDLGDFDRPY